MYLPQYDYNLSQLQAQLTAQLEQEQADIEAQQQFSEFMRGTQADLLAEQGEGRARASETYRETLGPAFQQALGNLTQLTTQQAADTEQRLAGDPARQVAMDTIRRAAAGEDIAGTGENMQVAADVRGEAVRGLGKVGSELAALSQEAAAPLAYQMELDRILRPFQTQAKSAKIAQTVAGTQSGAMEAQASALGGLMGLEAGPISTLAGLYGQQAGAFQPVAGGKGVIEAQFHDYGYRRPFAL
jgi:hypothetical protein